MCPPLLDRCRFLVKGLVELKKNKNSDDVHVSHPLPLRAIPACSAMLAGTGGERRQLGACHRLQLVAQQLRRKQLEKINYLTR